MAKAVIAADRQASSARKFFSDLDRLFGASIGVVFIRTREMERARQLIHEWCSLQGHDCFVWDHNHGIRKYPSLPTTESDDERKIAYDAERLDSLLKPEPGISGTQSIIAALDHMEERTNAAPSLVSEDFAQGMVCSFIDPTEEELNSPAVVQHLRDQVLRAHNDDDRMFMLVPPHLSLPDSVQADATLIELDPPSFTELKNVLSELAEGSIQEALDYTISDDDLEEIAQNGLGMTEAEFSNAVSIATVELANSGIDPSIEEFVKGVRANKLELIRQTEVLDLINPAPLSEVGGLDLLKADLQKQRLAFSPEAREYGLDNPKGFIVTGPPGTGKSLICKATSSVLGLPAIVFNLSAVFSSYVGSSEQRLRANLKLVEAMAPCVLFIDEFDKAIPQGNENDSGTSSRILGTMLTWLNDRQERGIPIYVIASANDVTRLPVEVLRKGRFDNVWAVGMPTDKERADILRIHIEKRGHELSNEDLRKAAARSPSFVGAELESVVAEALLNDFHEGNDGLTVDNVIKAIEKTTPQAKAFPERIKFMQEWAEQNARMASSGSSFVVEDAEAPRARRKLRTRPTNRPSRSRMD